LGKFAPNLEQTITLCLAKIKFDQNLGQIRMFDPKFDQKFALTTYLPQICGKHFTFV
jgi:hypothetical protein